MKLDLLYEMEMPKPWNDRSEYSTYWQAMEQIELADEMGFDTVWEVEHHFLAEFSHSSAPEVFLSAVAQRTQRIRIGHGVVLLPYPFNHPIRVAERIAVLDIVSNGRVEFGTGRSSRYEQEAFGISMEESRALWQEALEIIPQMWTQESFGYQGRYFKIPPRPVIPKPVQKPHPRIWVAATSPETWEIAGRNGIGPLGLTLFVNVPQLQEHIQTYRRALQHAKPVGKFVNDQVGAFTIVHCADTNQKARDQGAQAAVWYLKYAFQILAAYQPASDASASYREFLTGKYPIIHRIVDGTVTFEELDEQDMVIVGDPDRCIEKLEIYRQAGLDRVLCLMQAGRIPHQQVMNSIRLFGDHVIPHFATAEIERERRDR